MDNKVDEYGHRMLCCLACSFLEIGLPGSPLQDLIDKQLTVREVTSMDKDSLLKVFVSEIPDEDIWLIKCAARRLLRKDGDEARLIHEKYYQQHVVRFNDRLLDGRLPGRRIDGSKIIEIFIPKGADGKVREVVKAIASNYVCQTERDAHYWNLQGVPHDIMTIIKTFNDDAYSDVEGTGVSVASLDHDHSLDIVLKGCPAVRKIHADLLLMGRCTMIVFDKLLALEDECEPNQTPVPRISEWISWLGEIFNPELDDLTVIFFVREEDFNGLSRAKIVNTVNNGINPSFTVTKIFINGDNRGDWEIDSS